MATEFAKKNCKKSDKIAYFDGLVIKSEPRDYLHDCIDLFDRTLEQVLDVDSTLNANTRNHHHEIESSAPISLSLENFNVKNGTFSTYLDHIPELDKNARYDRLLLFFY